MKSLRTNVCTFYTRVETGGIVDIEENTDPYHLILDRRWNIAFSMPDDINIVYPVTDEGDTRVLFNITNAMRHASALGTYRLIKDNTIKHYIPGRNNNDI